MNNALCEEYKKLAQRIREFAPIGVEGFIIRAGLRPPASDAQPVKVALIRQ